MYSIFYQNVGRAKSKLHDIFINSLNNNYDMICLTETNFNSGIYDGESLDSRYNIFRRDRENACSVKQTGGGVLIAVKNYINVVHRDSWESRVEDVWLTVLPCKPGQPALHICLCYLPPDLPIDDIIAFHLNCQNVILNSASGDHFVVIGDFNSANISWEQSSTSTHLIPANPQDRKSALLMETMHTCDLLQLNTFPNGNNRFLDLVFSTLPDSSVAVKVAEPLCRLDSHHFAYELNITNILPVKPMIPNLKKRYNFNKCDYPKVRSELGSVDWEGVLSVIDVNACVDVLYNRINDIISRHTPYTRHKSNKYPPWYSPSLIQCIREKNKIHKRYKVYNNPRDYDTFALLRSRSKSLIAKCYSTYISSIEETLPDDPKIFWRYVNETKGRVTIPNTITYNGKTSHDGQEICELFSEYFGSVYGLPDVTKELTHFPLALNFPLQQFEISEREVCLKMKQVDMSKGSGPDEIPPKFIRFCAEELCKPLAIIYNKSISSGTFPSRWKCAHIVPVFKAGDRSSCGNYRPISILSCLPKLFESLVYPHLYNHFIKIISNSQHGFVKNRSTLSNLLLYKNYLCKAFASGGQVDAVYLDFSKAFDKVNHYLLCLKLAHYGIHGCLLRWIKSYLDKRLQLVTAKGYSSSPITVTSGVPQGSHLGPLLFVVFINDLTDCLTCPALLYADDLKIFTNIENSSQTAAIQNDLEMVSQWCRSNDMKLNVDKCCVISFTRKKKKIIQSYLINDRVLIRVESIKDLGVIFDEQLSFRPHYDHITKKGRQLLGFILRTTKAFKKPQSTLGLFFSLVRSIVEYCCPVWSPYYKVHVDNLERIQKRCLRSLSYKCSAGRCLKDYNAGLSKFGVLSLETRRKRYDLLCLHRILHATIDAPDLLASLDINTRHISRRPNTFVLQVYRNNISYYSPLTRMCRFYNEVASDSKDIDIFNPNFARYKKLVTDLFTT
jgi:hypothetical protein